MHCVYIFLGMYSDQNYGVCKFIEWNVKLIVLFNNFRFEKTVSVHIICSKSFTCNVSIFQICHAITIFCDKVILVPQLQCMHKWLFMISLIVWMDGVSVRDTNFYSSFSIDYQADPKRVTQKISTPRCPDDPMQGTINWVTKWPFVDLTQLFH